VIESIINNPERVELTSTDILSMKARVKHLDLVDFAEAQLLTLKAEECYEKTHNQAQSIRLFKMAHKKFENAISSNSQSTATLYFPLSLYSFILIFFFFEGEIGQSVYSKRVLF